MEAELPDWNTGSRSGLVPIGTHSLWLEVSGPDRVPGQPVVLILQGLGSCTSAWAAVVRLLQPSLRVVIYDRSGLGKSEPSPGPPSLREITRELIELLARSMIKPPYLIVAHSWGGVLAQDFISSYPDACPCSAGLVLVDANNECTLEDLDWRPFIHFIQSNGVDMMAALKMEKRHQMSDREWLQSQADAAQPKHQHQSQLEYEQYATSISDLGHRRILNQTPPLMGSTPVAIIVGTNWLDVKMLFEAAVEAGVGSFEEMETFERRIKDWDADDYNSQREATRLSSHFWVHQAPENSGHQVHMTEPRTIVGVIKIVMAEAARDGRRV